MSRSLRRFAGLQLFLCIVLSAGCGGSRRERLALPKIAPSESFAESDILPHTEGELKPGRNYVYCATFQLAWDEMESKVFKQPVALSGDPALAIILNSHGQPQVKLDVASYVALAGVANDHLISHIRTEIEQKFPAADIVPPKAEENALIAFAVLIKSLPFSEAFDPLKEPIPFRHAAGVTNIAGFGFRGDLPESTPRTRGLLAQVDVLSHTSSDDFVVRLKPQTVSDQILLAKLPRPMTLAAAIEAVKSRIKNQDPSATRIGADETLAVPLIALGVRKRYAELEGRNVENSPWKEQHYYLDRAEQDIRFRLDEYGAELSSTAHVSYKSAVAHAEIRPRTFVFDGPFLLLLRNGAAEPYFAMWIETPELLVKAGR